MVSFRAGAVAPDLRRRAGPSQVGAIAKRDLRRYYWMLDVGLASAPPVTPDVLRLLAERARAAHNGDLTAVVFAVLELLPGWNVVQLLALADALERLHRRLGDLRPEDLQRLPGHWHGGTGALEEDR